MALETKGTELCACEPRELLRQYLEIYDSYHNHKEVMAYTVTAFYVGGAAVLLGGTKFWEDDGVFEFGLLLSFLLILAGIAFWFVRRQLLLRRSAGDMFKACSRLACRWLTFPPNEKDLGRDDRALDEILFRGFVWPHALVEEMKEVQRTRDATWWARDLTYAAMFSSGVIVLLRLFVVWHVTRKFMI